MNLFGIKSPYALKTDLTTKVTVQPRRCENAKQVFEVFKEVFREIYGEQSRAMALGSGCDLHYMTPTDEEIQWVSDSFCRYAFKDYNPVQKPLTLIRKIPRCGCKKTKYTGNCMCLKANTPCTILCECKDDFCQNNRWLLDIEY